MWPSTEMAETLARRDPWKAAKASHELKQYLSIEYERPARAVYALGEIFRASRNGSRVQSYRRLRRRVLRRTLKGVLTAVRKLLAIWANRKTPEPIERDEPGA